MSQENVEIVRRCLGHRCASRGVNDDVLDHFADDCVMEDFPGLSRPRHLRGQGRRA